MNFSYSVTSEEVAVIPKRKASFLPILLLVLALLFAATSAYFYYQKRSAERKASDYLHTLYSFEGSIGNVERLENRIIDSSTAELAAHKFLGGRVRAVPTAKQLESAKDGPYFYSYSFGLFELTFYWSLEADAKTSVSEAKAKEVLAQMTPEERSAALTDGKIDLAKYGIDFSDQKQKVAVALERHFLNTLRKVAESG